MDASELTSIRTALGLTYDELAQVLGVHRTTVWRWEGGKAIPKATQMALRSLRAKGKRVVRDMLAREAA